MWPHKTWVCCHICQFQHMWPPAGAPGFFFFFSLMHPIGPELPLSAHVARARVCRQLYVLRASHALVQATVGVGTVILVHIGVAYTRGGGVVLLYKVRILIGALGPRAKPVPHRLHLETPFRLVHRTLGLAAVAARGVVDDPGHDSAPVADADCADHDGSTVRCWQVCAPAGTVAGGFCWRACAPTLPSPRPCSGASAAFFSLIEEHRRPGL